MHTDTRETIRGTAFRALVVDDEPMAREYLKLLLSRAGGVEVVGEAEDAAECLERVRELSPDVVFLDINMPGRNGVDTARALSQLKTPPFVVFVTGYGEYALPAFEVAAVDYITKPFSQERLENTLQRIRARLGETRHPADAPAQALGRLAIRDREGAKLIPVDDICYISTQGRKVVVRTEMQVYSTNHTLAELEHKLQGYRFFRANEGCIVNLDKVKEVVYEGPRTYELLLGCGEKELFIPLSRSRTQKLRELLDF